MTTFSGTIPIRLIPIERIKISPTNPRKSFNNQKLEGLAESLRADGILQPLIVREVGDFDFEIIAGERRYRAACKVGFTVVPCVLRKGKPEQILRWQLVENSQREGMPPLDEAEALLKIKEASEDKTIAGVAKQIGKSESYVSFMLALTHLPPVTKEALKSKHISKGVAWKIARLSSKADMAEATHYVMGRRGKKRMATTAVDAYLRERFGYQRKPKSVAGEAPPGLGVPDPDAKEFVANWRKYLIQFTAEQFLAWKHIVNGRASDSVMSEAVDVVVRDTRAGRLNLVARGASDVPLPLPENNTSGAAHTQS